ncbi:XkdX family protein [Paenibacillus agilis]|uniref:XkdX family protein n=1 Tax=Paenibacillus agilis TaxID=3020863 RepID=A0A559IX71_9BACL|nr:XkdX family protein [Paenibacillus agilis]TVX92235.1 XkdX family protein [Paenibacillus agilis]
MFNNEYERIKYYYDCGWATSGQLQLYVKFKVITAAEMQQILGATV